MTATIGAARAVLAPMAVDRAVIAVIAAASAAGRVRRVPRPAPAVAVARAAVARAAVVPVAAARVVLVPRETGVRGGAAEVAAVAAAVAGGQEARVPAGHRVLRTLA